jgi:hypothetical protein
MPLYQSATPDAVTQLPIIGCYVRFVPSRQVTDPYPGLVNGVESAILRDVTADVK